MTVTLGTAEAPPAAAEQRAPWQPRLVALVCNWCTYAGADMAGTARRAYAPTVRIVRVLCTGRLDPLLAVKAFEGGADGVIVSGCHPGDCHYVQGNLLARRRFTVFAALMDFLGLDRRRLHLAWVSASEGVKWARVVDEAIEAVRELGPLGDWTGPSRPAPPSLPDPGPAPRTPPPAEETEQIQARLRETAVRLLEEKAVSLVVGYGAGALPGQTVPLFVRRPEETQALVWNERCASNLLVYLPELRRRGEGRTAVVAKSCDAKALAGLVREHQISRDEVVLIGAPCQGVWADGRLALKCHACAEEVSPAVDVTVTPDGPVEGVPPAGERATGPDPRDAQIEALQALSAEERRGYWQRQLARCLRCYACRAVCPLCYCPTCIVDRNRPRWIPVTFDGRGNTAWTVARAMHLAGRCVGCDECARACPAAIRLDLLNRRVAVEIERRYGSVDPDQPAPLLAFRPDDPDEFL